MADDVGKLTIITSSPTLISVKHKSGNKNSNLSMNLSSQILLNSSLSLTGSFRSNIYYIKNNNNKQTNKQTKKIKLVYRAALRIELLFFILFQKNYRAVELILS